jgi:hypothetical protein
MTSAAAAPTAAKKKKKPKGALDRVVQRLYSAQEWIDRFQKQLGPHGDELAEPALETAREKAGLAYQALVDFGHAMPPLKASGWKPPAGAMAAGDLVQVKPARIGRFVEGGAFTPLQLARLILASVHGKYGKFQLADGTPIGLYPLNYFKPAPKALQLKK